MKSLDVEILAVGKWNGIEITEKHLNEIIVNFSKLKETVQVYLKLGHNKEQKVTDGEPALGWAEKLWVNGSTGKLMAKFVNIPDVVFGAMQKKLYRNVSIEALLDVKHKGEQYGTVLTAVALLGADMPAVNTLSDLQTYMSAGNDLQFSSRLEFSAISGSIEENEENVMSKELAEALAEVERLKGLNTAQNTALSLSAKADVDKDAKIVRLEAEAKVKEDTDKKVEFARRTDAVTADLENLVKSKTITPAKRDELVKQFTAESADSVEFTINTLKSLAPASKEEKSDMKGGDDKSTEADNPDGELHTKAMALSAKNSISFTAAVEQVMLEEPKLAREYADQVDNMGDE